MALFIAATEPLQTIPWNESLRAIERLGEVELFSAWEGDFAENVSGS